LFFEANFFVGVQLAARFPFNRFEKSALCCNVNSAARFSFLIVLKISFLAVSNCCGSFSFSSFEKQVLY
jgi:hypothetical protein